MSVYEKAKVVQRCEEIHELALNFIASLPADEEEKGGYSISSSILFRVVMSYFQDISALKFETIDDRNSSQVNEETRAGYLCYWISRFRPIQVTSKNDSEASLIVNDLFAAHLFLVFLRMDARDLEAEAFTRIVYDLHYMKTNPQSLTTLGSILRKSTRREFADG